MAGLFASQLIRAGVARRSYATNSLFSIGGYALSSGLTLIFGVVAARALGPEANGSLSLLLVVVSTVTVLINVGLGQAAMFSINRERASVQGVAGELWTISWLWGGLAAVAVFAGCSIWNLISPGTLSNWVIGASVVLTPPLLAKHYAEYLFAALHRFGQLTMVLASEFVLRLILFPVLVRWHGGLEGGILAVVFAALGSTLLGWAGLIGSIGAPRVTLGFPTLRPLLSYGRMNYLSVLLAHLNLRVDQFLIAAFLPVRELGIYVAAVILAELPTKVATALSKVVFVRVASSDAIDATHSTSATLRIVMTLAWLVAAVVWLSRGPLIVLVFGAAYAEAGLAMAWLLPGAALFNYVQILNSDLAGRGYPGASAWGGAAGLVCGIVANLTLTPRLGIVGAAISTSLGYAVNATVVVFRYCSLTGESPLRLVVATRQDVLAILSGLRSYCR